MSVRFEFKSVDCHKVIVDGVHVGYLKQFKDDRWYYEGVDSALGSDLVARLAKTHKNLNVIKGRVRKLIDGDTKDFGKD